jgi:hypothetical protein
MPIKGGRLMINPMKAILNPRSTIKRKWVQSYGDYESKIKLGVILRPNYGYCLYHAAKLAVKLGYKRISAVEFGVAGGNGLLAFEYHAEQICKLLPIEIEVYGFDTGEGLPEPTDYRDLLYHWQQGFFRMDVKALEAKLKRAKLILGNVSDTIGSFFEKYKPAPIGAISFDLDFYSSTRDSFAIFQGAQEFLMPRIFCYFDDTIGSDVELYNDFTGQRLAINEFNNQNEDIKLGVPYYLPHRGYTGIWVDQIWVAHLFKHTNYNTFISDPAQQLPL